MANHRSFVSRTLGSLLYGLALAASLPGNASAALVSSGVANITGTWSFDFDAGSIVNNYIADPAADIFWEQYTATTRGVEAVNSAQIVNLGTVSFAAITNTYLAGLSYGNTPISGSDVGNQLSWGDVFAVHTNDGNYAKVLVTAPFFDTRPGQNNGLLIYWETLTAPVPEPESYAMFLAGLGLMGTIARRRNPKK